MKIKNEDKCLWIWLALFLVAIFLILFFRISPYFHNNIPLGYDTGMYKYALEQHNSGQPLDNWATNLYPRAFLFLMDSFYFLDFSTNQILIGIFIFFHLLLGVTIFFVAKKFFNEKVAIIALFLYAVSIIQFKFFTYLYYKNVIGLILFLWSFYFLKVKRYVPLIIFSGFLGGIHRPTFFLFGLCFIMYAIFSSFSGKKLNLKELKINVIAGFSVLALALLFYIGRFKETIFLFIRPIVVVHFGAGTFTTSSNYLLLSLFYLPFAVLGLLILIKKEKFSLKSNILFLWFIINALIVVFHLWFYKRFIVPLDISMIIFASLGMYFFASQKLKQIHKIIRIIIVVLLIIFSGCITMKEAINAQPLINQQELEAIQQLNQTEPQAVIMSTSGDYSPWLVGYSGRKVIAPGLFDYDNWTKEEWEFWYNSGDPKIAKDMIEVSYSNYKPIYIFVGAQQFIDERKFKDKCFELYLEKEETKIYKYSC